MYILVGMWIAHKIRGKCKENKMISKVEPILNRHAGRVPSINQIRVK